MNLPQNKLSLIFWIKVLSSTETFEMIKKKKSCQFSGLKENVMWWGLKETVWMYKILQI